MKTILVSWSSWFIGFHLSEQLLKTGNKVIGFDNENDYYDVSLKQARRKILEKFENFKFYKWNLENFPEVSKVFKENQIDKVVNLAAQAWVRYSLINPFTYIQSNVVGFHNILHLSKEYKIQNFVYASSSSVYGNNKKQPFSVEDQVDNPISLYAATKKSNELIAHSYSHLFWIPTIGLRFFTVYGPWSRPDMAQLKFALKIINNEAIEIYNHWNLERDFTYIDDIVDGIIKALEYTGSKYEIFNLWNDHPINLNSMIELLETAIGKKAIKMYLPMQAGDVHSTRSDISYTKEKLWWQPSISIEEGIKKFWEWFISYYHQ